jgi:type IV secretion system protein TrbL
MRPSLCCLALVVVAVALGTSSASASALPGPCDVVGIPFVPDPAQKACETITGAAGDVAGDVVGDAANAVAQPIFRQVTEWVAQGAAWLVGRVGALIDSTTTPRLQSRWFAAQYAQMALLASALALPLLFLAVIQAALARNPQVMARALAAVPIAFVLTGGAVALVATLIGLTDWACQAISGHTGPDSRAFFHDVANAFATITKDAGPTAAAPALFVALLASVFAALAALAVWVELLIRSAGIYVCVLFFPVVLVARIWPKLEKWAARLAEALTALVLSKFVIVAVLSVAGAAMANSRASEGFNGVLAAGALLVFAAFAPLVLFRLVQFVDPQLHSRGGSVGSVMRAGQTTMSAAQSARIAMNRHAAGGGPRTAMAADMARGNAGAGRPSSGGASGTLGTAGGRAHPAAGGAASMSTRSGASRPPAGAADGAGGEHGERRQATRATVPSDDDRPARATDASDGGSGERRPVDPGHRPPLPTASSRSE